MALTCQRARHGPRWSHGSMIKEYGMQFYKPQRTVSIVCLLPFYKETEKLTLDAYVSFP